MNTILKLVHVPSIDLMRLLTWDQRKKSVSKKAKKQIKRHDIEIKDFSAPFSIEQKFL